MCSNLRNRVNLRAEVARDGQSLRTDVNGRTECERMRKSERVLQGRAAHVRRKQLQLELAHSSRQDISQ